MSPHPLPPFNIGDKVRCIKERIPENYGCEIGEIVTVVELTYEPQWAYHDHPDDDGWLFRRPLEERINPDEGNRFDEDEWLTACEFELVIPLTMQTKTLIKGR